MSNNQSGSPAATPSLVSLEAGASGADTFSSVFSRDEAGTVRHALEFSRPFYAGHYLPTGEPVVQHVQGVTAILMTLGADSDALVAGLLHALPRYLEGYEEKLQAVFGSSVVHLVEGIARMNRIREWASSSGHKQAEDRGQVEALRKMLLAMAEDVRVVMIALASRLQTTRYLARNAVPQQIELAHETLNIFSPLANRLGLWQMKWELEDLSFRITEPERYRKIAALLEETRRSREQHIALVVGILQNELRRADIGAEVTGRPKHIYSIHKKMKRKGVSFQEIYDAHAVRILVNDVRDCYAALGVVHNLWIPIPKEFDDYIAKPKGNDYRSLHTTVTGPEEKAVEVQIRTHEMHHHSELGVAAHWRYKEGARRDARYEEKIAWLRQILGWKNDIEDADGLAEQFKTALFEESVYVLTPQGRVISLPRESTPVDFAYHVHSDLGHRCRGAKVDGTMVPLNYKLQNAQRVEIISVKQGGPSRDWLNPALGYLKSQRARVKVRQWFSAQAREAALGHGRMVVEKELQRHGMTSMSLEKLAGTFGFGKIDEFLGAVARGEINARQLTTHLSGETESAPSIPELPVIKKTPVQAEGSILVVGVDKLLTVLAKCCKPAPPDPIIGFVTRGRGITVHRRGCANVAHLRGEGGARLIAAEWDASRNAKGISYAIDIDVQANDRPGLLRDISQILSREKINVTSTRTRSRGVSAVLQFTLEITDLSQLGRVLALIENIPDVISATRK